MPVSWPVGLQDKLNESGFGFKIGETVLRSDMDIGPAKVRRRFTRSVDNLTGTILLNYSQYSAFYTFFNVSLNGGATSFYYANPITGVTAEYRFIGTPSFRAIGGGNFEVSMEWESLG